MLIIETTNENENIISPGLFKLNTEYSRETTICECTSTGAGTPSLYTGIVEILDTKNTKTYRYRLNTETTAENGTTRYALPHSEFKSLWTTLIWDEEKKYEIFRIVHQIASTCHAQLTEHGINKAVLLHGPPGVGKTTFCKALAQKLAVRTGRNYVLKEIRCQNVISRFYGESLQNLLSFFDDCDSDVIYLVDEVDSLLLKRSYVVERNEPLDSGRIVSLVLSILDKRKNLFLFTSNFINELDEAFVDRCDLIYKMENPGGGLALRIIQGVLHRMEEKSALCNAREAVRDEKELAELCKGLSPRRLRKVLFLLANRENGFYFEDLVIFLRNFQNNFK